MSKTYTLSTLDALDDGFSSLNVKHRNLCIRHQFTLDVLDQSVFELSSAHYTSPCPQYTMLDLLERIQASEQELLAQLETIHACQVDGKMSPDANTHSLSAVTFSYTKWQHQLNLKAACIAC